jgi:hypothetical protein
MKTMKEATIQEYKTAAANTLKELDPEVNSLIKKGFVPFGSPYCSGKTEGKLDAPICQAMVRYGSTDAQNEFATNVVKAYTRK